MYTVGIIGCGVYLFITEYQKNRTESFISIDPKSGVCKDDSSSSTCCEIPLTITGDFMLDSNSSWNTEKNFDLVDQIYLFSLEGLQYTNEQWSEIVKSIDVKVKDLGLTRGSKRDFSWNLIGWVSYTSFTKGSGSLQYTLSGDASIAFDKPIVGTGFASGLSDNVSCYLSVGTNYQKEGHTLSVEIDLDDHNNCKEGSNGGYNCTNPCPGIISMAGMGYDTQNADDTLIQWEIDMASVSTAIAVNMGQLSLKDLQNFTEDSSREYLLSNMLSLGYIDGATYRNTSSYFRKFYILF